MMPNGMGRAGVLPLIAMLVALQILLLPIGVGFVMARPGAGLGRRLAVLMIATGLAAAVVLVAALLAKEQPIAAVLRGEAVAGGFAVFLAGIAALTLRLGGPRIAQTLTGLLGLVLLAGIILVGPVADLTQGPAQETVVRAAVHANPLVVAEREFDLDWLHSALTYRLSPLGDSYAYFLGDVTWWKTLLLNFFVGSGLLVFSLPRPRAKNEPQP
jgi:hypothetical protein